MMIATVTLCIELDKVTHWTTLYWWNYEAKTIQANGKSSPARWQLDNKKTGSRSVPAYNFDYLFQKLRLLLKLQKDEDLLDTMKLLLSVDNPANALCELAISLAAEELIR